MASLQRRIMGLTAVIAAAASSAVIGVGTTSAATAAITVSSEVIGTTPPTLGYNIAHAMAGSNVADWWRYSGARGARVFLSASDIEPTDDISGVGDGVVDRASFDQRRAALRANAANPSVALDTQYVRWSAFTAAYGTVATGNNRFAVSWWFPQLRSMGVDILVNITASPSRFPLADSADHANMWELWQHYYAQAFLLARDHQVTRFSMFNEPNGWSPAISVENWARRLRVASDAIQSAIADVNARYGTSLTASVFAPNTANGATKYDDRTTGDYWGEQAMLERGLDRWGEPAAGWSNFHVYNYQKYSMNPADYSTDYEALAAKIAADATGASAPMPPIGLTEYNVRTGANYDARAETGDSPSDFAALGATSVALVASGASAMYLFKFGMTERTGTTTYPVAKNGTHYVNNASTGVNEYGGAAGTAEVYRLFLKASGRSLPRLAVASTLGAAVAVQATLDASTTTARVFVANTGTTATTVDLDLSALGLAEGSVVTVEEVSTTARGAIVRTGALTGGRVAAASMPAQSVWLVTVHGGRTASSVRTAVADIAVADGTGKATTGGAVNPLVVRADGTVNGRRAALVRFAVPTSWTPGQRVLLGLDVSTTAGSTPVQAHVYGIEHDAWSEASATFSSLTQVLEQNVAAGNVIANNVVAGQGTTARIVGQLMADSTTAVTKWLDVTDFAISQTDGFASFLVVQDHRFDVKLPEKTTGDTQPAGLRIVSREGTAGPRLVIHSSGAVPPSTTIASTTTTLPPTTTTTLPPTTTTLPPTTTTTAPVVRVVAEFESLVVAASSGDSTGIKSDTQASGGKSVLYRSNAVGDFVVFRVNVPAAGAYSVEVTAKMMNDRGVFQLSVGDSATGPFVDVDTVKDEYRAAITFGSVGVFTAKAVFATAGTKFLRFRVTGRNAASSGFNLNFDRLVMST